MLRRHPLIVAILLVLLPEVIIAESKLTDGLLFHASFTPDSDTWATGRAQLAGRDLSRVEGLRNVALQTSSDGLGISAPGNFSYPRGSASFWVRLPASVANGLQKLPNKISFLDTENFRLHYESDSGNLVFMTGATLPDVGYKWDYGCSARLPTPLLSSGWRHLAITWDASTREKKLYLDGREVAGSQTERIRQNPPRMELTLRFGGGKDSIPLQFDEINLWNRVLAPDEVANLANPENIAAHARAVASLPSPSAGIDLPVKAGLHLTPTHQIEKTIIAPGESFTVSIPVTNITNRSVSGTVRLALENFFGSVIDTRDHPLTLLPNATGTITQAFSPATQGIYRVAFSFFSLPVLSPETPATAADPALGQDVASFVVWPRDARLSDDSWFGLHVNSWADGHIVRQAARLGFRHNRNHNMLQATWWTRAQFDPGAFQWEQESSLTYNLEAGMQVMGQFMGTPWWAARDGELPRQTNVYPSGAVPRLDAFAAYVTETVKRYRDRIRLWEIGNEPDVSMFWRGTPEQFSEYVHVAARAARAADPQAVILGSGYASNYNFIRDAARAGAFRPLDALSIHIYHSPEKPPEIALEEFKKRLSFFRDLLARHTDKPDMPVYQSEGGSTSTTFLRGVQLDDWPPSHALPPLNWRSAAIRQVQSDVLLLGLGFTASYSYFWNPTRQYTCLSELDINNTPKPKAVARAALAAFLDGHRFHAHVRLSDDARLWAALFGDRDDTSTRAVIWTGDQARVAVDATVFAARSSLPELRDIMGAVQPETGSIEFSDTPVYLSSPLPPDLFAERLKSASLQIKAPALPLPATKQDQQRADIPDLPDYAAPVENPQGLFTIDLRPHANMGFADEAAGDGKGGWADEGPYNDARDLPTGCLVAYGVPFTVINPEDNHGKSVITLRGRSVTPTHPLRVDGIAINRSRVRALWFLHTAAWGIPGRIGHYTIHYADGSTLDIPLDIGKNTANWWSGQAEGEAARPWAVRVSNTLNGEPAWRYLRVWEWENPKPEVPILSLDFVSAGERQTPILVAITGVTW